MNLSDLLYPEDLEIQNLAENDDLYSPIVLIFRYRLKFLVTKGNNNLHIYIFLIGVHSMQGWTATTRHGVTKKKEHKKIKAYRKSV